MITVLIESKWNVNESRFTYGVFITAVLIESKWNVNSYSFLYTDNTTSVLIESKWNVNWILMNGLTFGNLF